jgi:hypothetical protein
MGGIEKKNHFYFLVIKIFSIYKTTLVSGFLPKLDFYCTQWRTDEGGTVTKKKIVRTTSGLIQFSPKIKGR